MSQSQRQRTASQPDSLNCSCTHDRDLDERLREIETRLGSHRFADADLGAWLQTIINACLIVITMILLTKV